MIRKKIAAAAAAWLCTFPSYATDALALEVGRGEDRTSLLRFAVVDRWNREPRALGRKWQLSGYWEASVALWDNATESTADVGVTPVFRFERGVRIQHRGPVRRARRRRLAFRTLGLRCAPAAPFQCRTGSPESGNQFRAGSGSVRAALSVRQSVLFGTMPSNEASST